MKRFLKSLGKQNRMISFVSLVLTLIGLGALARYAAYKVYVIGISNFSVEEQLLVIAFPIFMLLSISTISQNILNIFYREKVTVSGINVGNSAYNYDNVIDSKTKEIVLVSQNFRGALNGSLKNKIKTLLKNKCRVILIGTTYEAMKEICKGEDVARKHFFSSFEDIKEIYDEIDDKKLLKNFFVIFHPSASSLTTFFRDPFDKKESRKILILGPKYAQDKNKDNRYFNVIEAWDSKEMFEIFKDHLYTMVDPQRNSITLFEFSKNVLANHKGDIESKEYEDLLNWFVYNKMFSDKKYKIFNNT